MFRRFYVQKVLSSEGSMFRRSYVQKYLFRRSYVQKVRVIILSVTIGHKTFLQRVTLLQCLKNVCVLSGFPISPSRIVPRVTITEGNSILAAVAEIGFFYRTF